jgi:DNA mismatch repair protein MutS2
MKFFIRNSRAKTLLLIDEFGSGTEPHIGGAIAEGALRRLNENRAFGVITTHYSNLKHFAASTEGIVNASMLYDRHLMQPLFQLAIGNPGSSFAIEIARKIGLPEDVISYAQEKAGSDYIDFDKHLQDIARDKRDWETKRQNIRLKEKELDRLTEKYGADLKTFESQRKALLKEARTEAQNLVSQANSQIENTIRKIKESQAEKEKTREARAELETFRQAKLQADAEREDMIARKIRQINERKKKPLLTPAQGEGLPARDSKSPRREDSGGLQTGDTVQLKGQPAAGRILDIQGKNATVAFGNLKSTVKVDKLEKIGRSAARKIEMQLGSTSLTNRTTPLHTDELRKKRLGFATELDIRGLRADEALQTVMYFIDEALMFDAGRVRILHGTGTGALRQVVRDYLAGVKGISRFADEHVQFGGAGITVVEF